MAKATSTMRAPNKNGPRKFKSYPLLAAQKVYTVSETHSTTIVIEHTQDPIYKDSLY